ncbi:alpha-hydroxy acid oxidase [Halomonas sp. H2]|uniref:alpha-hydroxy acid oxidase n=1 Tax=Halomonas sp. H2 TaxID=261936 RepID=UPI003CF90401
MKSSNLSSDAVVERRPNAVPLGVRKYLALDDFQARARRFLPKAIYGYIAGGAETDQSLDANRAAFRQFAFAPRVLRDVQSRDHRRRLFGIDYDVPFGIAPMGFSALAALNGDVILARGAAAAGSLAICSAASLTPLERVAKQAGSRWFQAYLSGDETRIRAMVNRILTAGFDTLVITADVPVAANRENNARNGFDTPFRLSPSLIWQGVTHPRWSLGTLGGQLVRHGMPQFENFDAIPGPPLFSRKLARSLSARDKLSWSHIALIRDIWPGKLVVKGLLTSDDANEARQCGVDGIIVSNHGGRQLDGAISPLEVLAQIKNSAAEMTVMYDSGIRRGTDVLKALALGADFVFVGRPFLFAAAVAGLPGVTRAMALLREEIDRDMALLGIRQLSDLSPDLLRQQNRMAMPHTY